MDSDGGWCCDVELNVFEGCEIEGAKFLSLKANAKTFSCEVFTLQGA